MKRVKVNDKSIEFDVMTDGDIKFLDSQLTTFADAEAFADALKEELWQTFLPVDRGPHSHPRYSVVRLPLIGEKVSKAHGGGTEYYPCGYVTKISLDHKCIETSAGDIFYRYEKTAYWVSENIWYMVSGWKNRKDGS